MFRSLKKPSPTGSSGNGKEASGHKPGQTTEAVAQASSQARHQKRPEGRRSGDIDARIKALVALVATTGFALAVLGGLTWNNEPLAALLILAVLAMAAERWAIGLYGDSRVSVSFVPMFGSVVLAGLPGLALVASLAALASQPGSDRPIYKLLYNFGMFMVAGAGAVAVLHWFGAVGEPGAWPEVLLPSALAASVHFGVTSLLVATAIGFTTKATISGVWLEKFGWLLPHYIVLGFLGLAIATAYSVMGLWGIGAFVAPPVMMHLAMKQYVDRTSKNVLELKQAHQELQEAHYQVVEAMERLKKAYSGTLSSLIAALDTRDSETRGHSERVAEFGLAIAKEMGMVPDSQEWQDLQWGALLHDVGKIGVPDDILRKPGALSEQEWRIMKSHPMHGSEILKDIDFLQEAAEVVYAHHERFDGSGYPRGLAGEEIPMGARIFAIADAFDAMTSNRPYRKALSTEEAIAEIIRNSGSQFDPEAVEAFLKVSVSRKVFRHSKIKEHVATPDPAYEPAESIVSKP